MLNSTLPSRTPTAARLDEPSPDGLRQDARKRLTPGKLPPPNAHYPLTLLALFIPGLLFAFGLGLVYDHPRFAWLSNILEYPWEFWAVAVCGTIATVAGFADWAYHRSGKTSIGAKEHQSELVALVGGGLPVFVLMAIASVIPHPHVLLLPVVSLVLFTAVMICYDEFVFHRKRCGRYETFLHRLLVFGNGFAWLAWANWCFVSGGTNG